MKKMKVIGINREQYSRIDLTTGRLSPMPPTIIIFFTTSVPQILSYFDPVRVLRNVMKNELKK